MSTGFIHAYTWYNKREAVTANTPPGRLRMPLSNFALSLDIVCTGWIKNPSVSNTNPLFLLAASSDTSAITGPTAMRAELYKENGDWRLGYFDSRSKLIGDELSIDIDDGSWHFLTYACDPQGSTQYYVDSVPLSPVDGREVAWEAAPLYHGNYVWVPYIYEAAQRLSVYNWRVGIGLSTTQAWLASLMAMDYEALSPDQE